MGLKNGLFVLIALGQLFLDCIELSRGHILHKSYVQDGAVTHPVVCIRVTFHQTVVAAQLSGPGMLRKENLKYMP